jgi:hypothetical protein
VKFNGRPGVSIATGTPARDVLLLINGLLCLVNLIPYSKYIPEAGRRVGTDGWQIVQALRTCQDIKADASLAPIW